MDCVLCLSDVPGGQCGVGMLATGFQCTVKAEILFSLYLPLFPIAKNKQVLNWSPRGLNLT